MSIDRSAGTAAVLDEMVAGIMGIKANKAAKLTPVGSEGAPFVAKPQQFAPLESPYSGLDDACRRIREGIAMLEKYVAAIERDADSIKASVTRPKDALDAAWGTPVAPVPAPEESLQDRLQRLSAEAQAAAFGSGDWTCPVHGGSSVRQHTSPKGRVFMACEASRCKEFQKR